MEVYVTCYEETTKIEPKIHASPKLAYDNMLDELEASLYLTSLLGEKENNEFISEQITELKESYKTNPKEFGCDICWCVEHTVIGGA